MFAFLRRIENLDVSEAAFAELLVDQLERHQGFLIETDKGLVRVKCTRKNRGFVSVLRHLKKVARRRPDILQAGAATGRMPNRKPNLSNGPASSADKDAALGACHEPSPFGPAL